MSDKTEKYASAIKVLSELMGRKPRDEFDENYDMGDINEWVLVHATKYKPLKNNENKMYIPTTSMAEGFKIPRGTIHFTLNHVVPDNAHDEGDWTNANIVVLMPFQATIKENGIAPEEVAISDTYFCPPVDTGLLLPDEARVVCEGSDADLGGELFKIVGKITYYKVKGFTDEEKNYLCETIGEQVDCNAVDEKRLAKQSRNLAVKLTVVEMGYQCIECISDGGAVAWAVQEAANKAGYKGKASDKGHYHSVHREIENLWMTHEDIMKCLANKGFKEIYAYIKGQKKGVLSYEIEPYIDAFINGGKLNLNPQCKNIFNEYGLDKKHNLRSLAAKWCKTAAEDFKSFYKQLKVKPGFDKFIEDLMGLKDSNSKESSTSKESLTSIISPDNSR